MNTKHVLILAALAAASAAATAVTLRNAPQSIASDRRGERMFPALLQRANDVATISIKDNDREFTVERRDNGFFDKDSRYVARPESFRDMVAGAATMTFEEAKTADPARYGDLGLAEIGQGDKSGRLVTMRDAKGETLAQVIVGNPDATVGGARGGMYVRFPNSPQTWLARGQLRAPAPHAAWFDINLINLNRDALARLELSGGGLDEVKMAAEKKGEDLKLETPAPEGRSPENGKILRLSFMVDPLSFQDVRAPKGDVKPDARKLVAFGHNGLKINVTSVGPVEDGWVRMAVEATTEESKAQAAELAPKIDGFEFKLSKNDSDMMGWSLKDFTAEAKS
jgi:hypothetical protein